MVFGSDLSSLGIKIVKRKLHEDYNFVKIYLTLQICGKCSFQPENARFYKNWLLAVI